MRGLGYTSPPFNLLASKKEDTGPRVRYGMRKTRLSYEPTSERATNCPLPCMSGPNATSSVNHTSTAGPPVGWRRSRGYPARNCAAGPVEDPVIWELLGRDQ